MRIAILDDEPLELGCLQNALKGLVLPDGERPNVHSFSSSATLLRQLKQETFDILILDWQLPEISGLQILHWVRAHLLPAPAVVMLTVRNAEQDVVRALDAGAADYVCKPFRPAELLARLKNIMRTTTSKSQTLVFGDIFFDTNNELVSHRGKQVPLTPREYRLALLLFTNLGRPLSRQYLYDHVWLRNEKFVSRSLDTHIYRLRTKLNLFAEDGWVLSSIYAYGYRLTRFEGDDVNYLNSAAALVGCRESRL